MRSDAPVDAVDAPRGPTRCQGQRSFTSDDHSSTIDAVLDGDDGDLQDAVAAKGEPGRLDVDHREPGESELPGHGAVGLGLHACQPRPPV